MFDNRAISVPATRAVSITRTGSYTQVEVWTNKTRFKITFERFLNLVSIQRFVREGTGPDYLCFWQWKQEFHRSYRRRSGRSLHALHVDIVHAALELAHMKRRGRDELGLGALDSSDGAGDPATEVGPGDSLERKTGTEKVG